jgi:hypothetical protein
MSAMVASSDFRISSEIHQELGHCTFFEKNRQEHFKEGSVYQLIIASQKRLHSTSARGVIYLSGSVQ